MTQIIPAVRGGKSFMDSMLGGAAETLPAAVQQYFQQKKQAEETKKRNETVSRLAGMDLAGLPPEIQQAYVVEKLKQSGATEQQKADLYKALEIKKAEIDADMQKEQRQQALVSGAYNQQGNQPQQPQQAPQSSRLGTAGVNGEERPDMMGQAPQQGGAPRVDANGRPRFSSEQIALMATMNPAVAREMRASEDEAIKQEREDTTLKEKKKAALREETLPIKKEIVDRAQNARMGIENKEHLLELIEKGDINDPTYAALSESLPLNLGKRLLSPDTVEYKAGLIDEYKDLRQIFQGQTRIKEIELLEAKTADIYLTDAQKKAILNSRINALKVDLIREEAAIELEDEGKDYSLLQYRKAIEQKVKPKMAALFNRILDEQKAIIKDAENMKQTPLNYDDPEGRVVLEQILKEANGDKNKARQIAKKKGYTIGT